MTNVGKARRRGNGEGSVYRRGNRWVAAKTIDWVDGKPVRRKRSGRTKAEALRALRTLEREYEANVKGAGRTTVATFLEYWLSDILPTRRHLGDPISGRTIENYSTVLRVHVLPEIGTIHLDRLTAEHVDRVLTNMATRGKARNTIMRVRSVLVLALDHAERRGHVMKNAARLAVVPSTASTRDRRAFTAEQAKMLMSVSSRYRYGNAWLVQLQLGLRPGEVLALTWGDLDFDTRVLHVRSSIHCNGGALSIGKTKTPKSVRNLAMPSTIVAALKRHKKAQASERLKAGELWEGNDLVFPTAIGTITDPRYYRRSFQRATKMAGLGDDWTPHELRHSCVSLLSQAGVPLEQIADQVGHASTRMTAEIYRHVISPSIAAAVSPMEALFGDEAAS